MAQPVKDIDRGFKRISRLFNRFKGEGIAVTVGIQGPGAAKSHGAGLTNVKLAGVHEFGAKINHPGGTSYMIVEGGKALFVKKGDPRAVGVTKPHKIIIPERSFLRSTFDSNLSKYKLKLDKIADRSLDGTSLRGELLLFGEGVRTDVIKKIKSGVSPPLKAATVRRKKGEKTQLIDTGQLLNSISAVVR